MENINPFEIIYIGNEQYIRVSEISEVSLKDENKLRIVLNNSNEYYIIDKDINKTLFRILYLISGNYSFIPDDLIVLDSFVNLVS